jgi:alpha-glucosidase
VYYLHFIKILFLSLNPNKYFMCKKLLVCIVIIICSANAFAQNKKKYEVSSPDKLIKVNITNEEDKLFYNIDYKKAKIINPSKLGLGEFKDASENHFNENIVVTKESRTIVNESWKPVWGYNSSITNHYNSLILHCKVEDEKMDVEFRIFNEGVAFRYKVYKKENPEYYKDGYKVQLLGEATEFAIAQDGKAFWQPLMQKFGEHFENIHKITPVNEIDSCNTPFTMKLNNGVHISIHEAALINYTSTILVNNDKSNTLHSFLTPWQDGVAVKLKTNNFNTPWRTIQISPDAAGLINGAQMILNLNEPCKIKNTSWIKPMKFNGVWWEMHLGLRSWANTKVHGATTANTKKHIDFAAANGLQATLVEGWNTGWETFIGKEEFSYTQQYPDFDLEYLAAYAKKKGVQLMSHHETGNNIPDYERQMEAAYKQMKRLGQHSVKSGYVGNSAVMGTDYWHQSQRMVEHIQLSTETAAKYEVCIDPHETIKPTGICRTYPNLMSGEGVRGNEYNAWSDGNPPNHEIILAFTRGLAGPMDYTPGIFDVLFKEGQRRRNTGDAEHTDKITTRVHTTLSKQLALFVCLYSPIVMAADLPENYTGNKAYQFIKDVPVTFDETKVVAAEIGEYYTVARRNGKNWFVGGITNENPRTLKIDCKFLAEGKKYKAILYGDSKKTDYETTPDAYEIKEMEITNKTIISWNVVKSGGVAISIFEK